MLYFAYGSNLDTNQMARRCPRARPVGPAVLTKHALCFAGFSQVWGGAVASVTRRDGWQTEGLLYSVTPRDLDALDIYEGHPFVYRRRRKIVITPDGRRRVAYLYIHRARTRFVPGSDYLAVIRRAYWRYGFDAAVLNAAAWGLS